MACGCPVITSNATSLPEVVGDAGIMVDWDSDEQHLKAYEAYYFNPALRSEMAERGLKRAQGFSWKRCADTMIDTMVKVCDKS
jgi:glycosyltransferase involved in cell wall biosynthesis